MRRFEVGKRYGNQSVVHEITHKTAKMISFVSIHHPGRPNEKRKEEKTVKIRYWADREVFYTPGDETVEA